MKKNTSLVAALLLGAVVAVGPATALADHSSDDSHSETAATVKVEANTSAEGQGYGAREDVLRKKAELIERAAKERRDLQERFREGSTTGPRPASTTKPMLKERMEKGEVRVDASAKLEAKSGEMIDKRIESLKKQIERIAKMERLSDAQKTSITAELNAQITALTSLKASIGSETDATKLKELGHSITKAYRVYALTMPKAAITAASDRIMTVVAQMESFSAKLSARIEASATAGVDVTAARAAYDDYVSKVASAKVEAQAAASLVAGLAADNGDEAVAATNATALKAAKVKIDAAQADLKAARKDIGTILGAVKGTGSVKASAEARTSN